jgi:Ni/Co efflux regulator RcnB
MLVARNHIFLFGSSRFAQSLLERQRDRGTERQRDRETERQRDRETERQRDRETERQREILQYCTLHYISWKAEILKSMHNNT